MPKENKNQVGQKVIDWLHETNPTHPLAKLREKELINRVVRQTELIAHIGLRAGCAIVIPKSRTHLPYQSGKEVEGPILLKGVWRKSKRGKPMVMWARCVRLNGRNVNGQLRIKLKTCKPAEEEQIREIISHCYGQKWSM